VSLPSTGSAGSRPNFRLTYKVEGKTISESVPSPSAIQKAEREVEEFRKFQQLTREFLGTTRRSAVCGLSRRSRNGAEIKNGRSDSGKKHGAR